MAFAKDPAFKYLAYPIGLWRQKLSLSPKPAATLQYFEPLFRFVEGELAEGNNVMIHCLGALPCHISAHTQALELRLSGSKRAPTGLAQRAWPASCTWPISTAPPPRPSRRRRGQR